MLLDHHFAARKPLKTPSARALTAEERRERVHASRDASTQAMADLDVVVKAQAGSSRAHARQTRRQLAESAGDVSS